MPKGLKFNIIIQIMMVVNTHSLAGQLKSTNSFGNPIVNELPLQRPGSVSIWHVGREREVLGSDISRLASRPPPMPMTTLTTAGRSQQRIVQASKYEESS